MDQVTGAEVRRDGDRQAEVPQFLLAAERHAEYVQRLLGAGVEPKTRQREGGYASAVGGTGQRLGVEQYVLPDEDQAEGGDPEIDPAQPGRDRAEQQPGHTGQQHRGQGRDGWWQREAETVGTGGAGAAGENGVAVGADRDEEGMPERQLAGLAEKEGKAERRDGAGEGEQAKLQPEPVGIQRDRQRDEHSREHGHDCDGTARVRPRCGRGRPCAGDGRRIGDTKGATRVRHGAAPACRTGRTAEPAAPRP